MKKLVLLTFLVFSLCISGCEKIIEDEIQVAKKKSEEDIIKGGFKNCTEYRTKYTYNNGQLVNKTKSKWYSTKYDEKGKMIEKLNFYGYQDSLFDSRETKKYDERGNMIEEVDYYTDRDIPNKTSYKFDDNNKLIEILSIYLDNFEGINKIKRDKTIYKYDNNGNQVEEAFYENTKLVWTTYYKYDGKGNLLEETSYNKNQNLVGKRIRNYNNFGKIIKEECFDNEQKLFRRQIYKYTDSGKVIELIDNDIEEGILRIISTSYYYNSYKEDRIVYYKDGTIESKYYAKYDANGNRIEDNFWGSLNKYIFNKDGNFIKVICYFPVDKILCTTNYKYDNYGNILEILDYDEYNQLSSKTEYNYSK